MNELYKKKWRTFRKIRRSHVTRNENTIPKKPHKKNSVKVERWRDGWPLKVRFSCWADVTQLINNCRVYVWRNSCHHQLNGGNVGRTSLTVGPLTDLRVSRRLPNMSNSCEKKVKSTCTRCQPIWVDVGAPGHAIAFRRTNQGFLAENVN